MQSAGGGARFTAVVEDVREERRVAGQSRWQLLLDRTEFQVGDAGALEAVARSGVRLRVPVLRVFADEHGAVWHVVEKPLGAGTAVEGSVVNGAGKGLKAAREV